MGAKGTAARIYDRMGGSLKRAVPRSHIYSTNHVLIVCVVYGSELSCYIRRLE